MPKATIDEYGDTWSNEGKIWLYVGYCRMLPVTEASPPEVVTKSEFWRRVARAHCLHDSAAGCKIKMIFRHFSQSRVHGGRFHSDCRRCLSKENWLWRVAATTLWLHRGDW